MSADEGRYFQEKFDYFFGKKLTPLPNIEIRSKTFKIPSDPNGEMRKTKITFIADGAKTKPICMQIFCPKGSEFDSRCMYPGCTKEKQFDCWFSSMKRHLCADHELKAKMHIHNLRSHNANSHIASDSNQIKFLCRLMHKASVQRELLQEIISDKDKTKTLEELFLNVRNYLIILDSLVDINSELCAVSLSYIMDLIMVVLKNTRNNKPFDHLVHQVSKIIEESLFFFGIIYSWESIHIIQLGDGIRYMSGVLSTNSISTGDAVSMIVLSAIGGVCRHAYNAEKQARQQSHEVLGRYQDFRKIHKVPIFNTTKAYVCALLVAVIAFQLTYIFYV